MLVEKPKGKATEQTKRNALQKRLEMRKRKNKAGKNTRQQKLMEVEKKGGKDWKAVAMQKVGQLETKSGTALANDLIKLLKEHNKDLIYRIVSTTGDEKTLKFLKEAIAIYHSGGLKRKDNNESRSLGGTFLRLVKEDLDTNDPMKLKDVFKKSVESIQKRNIVKSHRRKERKRLTKVEVVGNTVAMPQNKKKDKKNPTANMFGSLAN